MTQKALLGRTWLRLLGSLRRRPGELETASDRSHERYRRAALSGSTMLLGRVLSAVSSLLTVRLTFHYLGAERYGMWMTISSVVLMLGSADLGLSNGLVNLIADAAGRGDERRAGGMALNRHTVGALAAAAAVLVGAGAALAASPTAADRSGRCDARVARVADHRARRLRR